MFFFGQLCVNVNVSSNSSPDSNASGKDRQNQRREASKREGTPYGARVLNSAQATTTTPPPQRKTYLRRIEADKVLGVFQEWRYQVEHPSHFTNRSRKGLMQQAEVKFPRSNNESTLMRQQRTLWESSSRPLFIKSVWVESSDGGYRHFILDYDNQKKLSEDGNKGRKVFKTADSYDFGETQSLNLQLIGSSKSCNPVEPLKPINRRRSQTVSPGSKSFFELLRRKASRDEQIPSKRGSIQDISNHETFNCDDKLAERVLNWLDLAGKTTIIKQNLPVSNPRIPKRTSATKRVKSSPSRPATAVTNKRPDSVKHITIIFNKEGIPIRYNRPVRFSDLFRSGYSASRKFISNIPSRNGKFVGNAKRAQLPGSAAFDRASMDLNKTKTRENPNTKQTSYETDYRSIINRQILENSCNLHEAKKQLHIFMPSLPKKTLTANDCDSSCLSTVFSDYCKIVN